MDFNLPKLAREFHLNCKRMREGMIVVDKKALLIAENEIDEMSEELKNLYPKSIQPTYVTDRKGHDMRYAIDPTKIHNELGWLPETKFANGIKKTIA